MDRPPEEPKKFTRNRLRSLLLSEKKRESINRTRKMTVESRMINLRRVIFFGASHIFNAPESERKELREQLDTALTDFESETKNKPVTYLIEGEVPKNEDLPTMQDHESALVVSKAQESSNLDVRIDSGDPALAELFIRIKDSSEFIIDLKSINIEDLGEFNNNDLALLYFFFRDCKLEDTSLKNIIFLVNFVNEFQNSNFFKSDELLNIVKSIEKPYQMSEEEKSAFLEKIQPFISQILKKLNKIQDYFEKQYPGMSISEIIENYDPENNSNPEEKLRSGIYQMATIVRRERDVYLLEKIQDETREGRNVFIVFGSSHLIRTRPALNAMSDEE